MIKFSQKTLGKARLMLFGCDKPGGRPLSPERAAAVEKANPGSTCPATLSDGRKVSYMKPGVKKEIENKGKTERAKKQLANLKKKNANRSNKLRGTADKKIENKAVKQGFDKDAINRMLDCKPEGEKEQAFFDKEVKTTIDKSEKKIKGGKTVAKESILNSYIGRLTDEAYKNKPVWEHLNLLVDEIGAAASPDAIVFRGMPMKVSGSNLYLNLEAFTSQMLEMREKANSKGDNQLVGIISDGLVTISKRAEGTDPFEALSPRVTNEVNNIRKSLLDYYKKSLMPKEESNKTSKEEVSDIPKPYTKTTKGVSAKKYEMDEVDDLYNPDEESSDFTMIRAIKILEQGSKGALKKAGDDKMDVLAFKKGSNKQRAIEGIEDMEGEIGDIVTKIATSRK
jgi:hypothetical protein